MKKLKMYWIIDCYAFTIVTLINAFFMKMGLADASLSMIHVIPIFMATTLTSFLMYLTDKVSKEKSLMRQLFHLIDVIIPVNLFEFFMNGFQNGLIEIVINTLMCCVFYGIVYLLMLVSWREQDQKTNEILEKLRKSRKIQ